ncbi:hypothetical protein Barb7_00855 [Bacteroidales bacterium Barb7]|nr:hypothetical protein Barb7_00855 [Bacteroidales bacterium Barb7]
MRFFIFTTKIRFIFPFTYFPLACHGGSDLLSLGKGVYVFFTGCKVRACGCYQNSSSFPSGERNFLAKLDCPKHYTRIAYETKTTDPTDDTYKKSQHDEKQ